MLSIGAVSVHGCIRLLKQCWLLAHIGYDVHAVFGQFTPLHSFNTLASCHLWNQQMQDGNWDTRQLANTVRLLDPQVDLWYIANEPNWIFRIVKENSKKPCVWDIHDWTSLREKGAMDIEVLEEEFALEHADGFVVPSRGYLRKIREVSKKPSQLVYSKVPGFFYPKDNPNKIRGLVYEGGLKGKERGVDYNFFYRHWADFAKQTAEILPNGDQITMYAAADCEDLSEYEHPKIKTHPPLNYAQLLYNLNAHSVGLVGSPTPLTDFQDSMPNKLFEYVAAGIPCMVLNSPEALAFVEENNLGVGIRDHRDVPEALKRLTKHHVLQDRWAYTMEGEIPKLIALFEEVLCQKSPRIIKQIDV